MALLEEENPEEERIWDFHNSLLKTNKSKENTHDQGHLQMVAKAME